MISVSEENYLKAIYELSHLNEAKVTPTAIAEVLKNNPASVIDMIKNLTKEKLVSYHKKTGVKLTNKGLKTAMDVVRKHRLWEVFLLEKLGYKWDELHVIAEQLEHVQYHDLADRLDKFLDYPDYDPHGEAIPSANGQLPDTSRTTLFEIENGRSCRVVAVKDTSSEFLQYLQKLGIGIGTRLKVIEKIPFDSSMIINIGKDNKTTISKKLGDNVLVTG
jgi:DtxR family Mn-dependent transcriptional regulator